MLDRIVGFIRRKVEEIVEKMYWKVYKKKVLGIGAYFQGVVLDVRVLELIINWTKEMDPIARFAIALKELGITSLSPIRVSQRDVMLTGHKLHLREQAGTKEWNIKISNSSGVAIISEFQEKNVVKQIMYDTNRWDFCKYLSVNSSGMKIEYEANNITIHNFLGDKEEENCKIYFDTVSRRDSDTSLFQLDCELSKMIEKEIHNYLQEVDLSQIKICKIYKIIEKCISKFYYTEQSSVGMKMKGISAKLKGNNLEEYHGPAVTIEPYDCTTHKVYFNRKGAWIDYQYNGFKICNMPSKNAQDFIEEAESAISEIENLNF